MGEMESLNKKIKDLEEKIANAGSKAQRDAQENKKLSDKIIKVNGEHKKEIKDMNTKYLELQEKYKIKKETLVTETKKAEDLSKKIESLEKEINESGEHKKQMEVLTAKFAKLQKKYKETLVTEKKEME